MRCFAFAVTFAAPVASPWKIIKILRKRPIRLQLKSSRFNLGDFLFCQSSFFRFTFPSAFLFYLRFRRVFAARFFTTNDCGGINTHMTNQLFSIVLLHYRRMDCIADFFLGKKSRTPVKMSLRTGLLHDIPNRKAYVNSDLYSNFQSAPSLSEGRRPLSEKKHEAFSPGLSSVVPIRTNAERCS